jgi:hypothetical protein
LSPRSPRPSPPPDSPERHFAPGAEEAEPPGPLPPGWADIKDQWRRYGLAEGMRNHSSANGAPERTEPTEPGPPEPPDADRLTNRVLELERALDIQAAIVRQMLARIDRLEREAAVAPGPDPRPDTPAAAADTVPTRVRLDETWSWVRARLTRGRD